MKRLYTLFVLSCFSACLIGQESVTIQPGYTHQTFYSFTDGTVKSSPLAAWDIAFEIEGFTAAIRTNSAQGVTLYAVPGLGIADWATVDTAGIDTWPALNNSDQSWTGGAFNQGLEEGNDFDLGWGVYNPLTHAVTGDSLYVINLPGDIWKKVKINDLTSGTYSFTIADLDGMNEETKTVAKSDFDGKNFGYYSITGDSLVDQEPLSAEWDLVFHKYLSEIAPNVYYSVSGVQINKGVTVAEVSGVLASEITFADTAGVPFVDQISAIGNDWKSFAFMTNSWTISDSVSFFVKRADEEIFQVTFTGFGGSSTGEYLFTLTSFSNSIEDAHSDIRQAVIAPNPVQSTVNVILDLEKAAPTQVEILDLQGRLVYQHDAGILSGFQQVSFAQPGLASGLYLVRITAGESIITRKMEVR